MNPQHHRFSELFSQLGLPAEPAAIQAFVAAHAPLPGDTRLEDASFWSPSQARLLREELCADADWAEVIDQLNALLRQA